MKSADEHLAEARELKVVDDGSYRRAGELGRLFTSRIKAVREGLSAPKKATYDAWKEVCKLETNMISKFEVEKRGLAQRIGAYSAQREEEARRAEEQRRAEARRTAEEEALRHAETLEKNGDKAAAQAEIDRASQEIAVPPPAEMPSAVKAEGVSVTTSWEFRITDEKAVPREYLVVDDKKIRGVVRALKADARIPGVEVYEVKTGRFKS